MPGRISAGYTKFRNDWKHGTWYLAFCVATFACGDLIFGNDTSSFGSMQALPSWLNSFGTPQPDGTLILTTYQKAICNSIIFIGRLVGCTTFEPVVERTGFRLLMVIAAGFQILAVIIQLTAKDWKIFTIGRVFAYLSVGFIENGVPVYSAEVAPPVLRGFCAGLLTPIITLSSVWGAGMCQAYAKETRKIGWMVPIGVQAIPAVILLGLLPLTVESPRWLVAHGKTDQALKSLKKLRRKQDADAGICEAEIQVLEDAIEHDRLTRSAKWSDLFRGSYRRRAIYCALCFWFYQTTGNSFYNAYGPSFFKQIGLGAKSFTYATVVQLVGAIGALQAILLTDHTGRRPLIIAGAVLLIVFDSLIAGLGSSTTRTTTANNVVVASFMLMLWSEKISWATHCYLVGSEIGGIRMRKKTMMVGTTVDLFASWLVGFTTPYIMNEPYGGIGGKIGYIFAGMSVLSLVFAVFFVPELKGRSLEEVDELFEEFRWGWQYAGIKTSGYGAAIAQLEGGDMSGGKTTVENFENRQINVGSDDSKGDIVPIEHARA